MLTKGRGIVLNSLKYGDDASIVAVYFENEGVVSFLCRAAKGRQGRGVRMLMQPLSVVEVEFDLRQNRQLQYMKEVRAAVMLDEVYRNPYKITIVMFVAEVLRYVLKGEKGNGELFRFIVESLVWLEHSGEDFASFHIVFLAKLLCFLGYNPMYDEEFREIVASKVGRDAMSGPRLDMNDIANLIGMEYEKMNLYAMNHSERNQCLEVLISYYKLRIPGFPELKSLEILREVYGN